jgi:SpoVK/Ycf46/Vps4 family AAA+-type ATPase
LKTLSNTFNFKACTHPRLADTSLALFSDLFPDHKEFRERAIYISGLRAKTCVKCGKVWINDAGLQKLAQLEITGKLLAKLYPADEKITIAFDDLVQGIDEKNKKKSTPDKLPEEATFVPVDPRFDMNDVILNSSTLSRIEEAKIKIKYAQIFYKDFGFEKIRPYGAGTVLNFFGPPGTGKTRTAEAFAKSMGLKFLDVNIADLESRYMSQTGKNILIAFETATKENALLFFDEADTVLGKRLSSVTQGIDAEINMSRSTMLKELERFKGVCIFATNFSENIDRAFIRRIGYHIEFEKPDLPTRVRLWNYILLDTLLLNEEREILIEKLAASSEGLAGADIATAVELTFPKAFILNPETPVFQSDFLFESIEEVKLASKEVTEKSTIRLTKEIFGLNKE